MEEERVIYGYMDGEYLNCMEISPIHHNKRDEETGEIVAHTISILEQVAKLPPEYKPVDDIDESRQETDRENYVVRIIPYDAGDRISFKYVEVPDLQKVTREIDELKGRLESSDYKIIKCYEAGLVGSPMPYDVGSLHEERQLLRDKINELEASRSLLSDEL